MKISVSGFIWNTSSCNNIESSKELNLYCTQIHDLFVCSTYDRCLFVIIIV